MQDETPSTLRPAGAGDANGEDEAEAELSRAARQAVRQPPDPRIEKSFAHLGLGLDAEPARPPTTDLAPVLAALAALQASTENTARQVRALAWAIAALAVVVGVLAVVVVTR